MFPAEPSIASFPSKTASQPVSSHVTTQIVKDVVVREVDESDLPGRGEFGAKKVDKPTPPANGGAHEQRVQAVDSAARGRAARLNSRSHGHTQCNSGV